MGFFFFFSSFFSPAVADAAREEFKQAEKKADDLKRTVEDLEKLLNVDLGPQQEFEPLQQQCYEFTDRE